MSSVVTPTAARRPRTRARLTSPGAPVTIMMIPARASTDTVNLRSASVTVDLIASHRSCHASAACPGAPARLRARQEPTRLHQPRLRPSDRRDPRRRHSTTRHRPTTLSTAGGKIDTRLLGPAYSNPGVTPIERGNTVRGDGVCPELKCYPSRRSRCRSIASSISSGASKSSRFSMIARVSSWDGARRCGSSFVRYIREPSSDSSIIFVFHSMMVTWSVS